MSELHNHHCGCAPDVDHQAYGVVISCPDCYDGAPDAGPQDIASATTLSKAVEAWNEQMLDFQPEASVS